jgi:hypothetical protein
MKEINVKKDENLLFLNKILSKTGEKVALKKVKGFISAGIGLGNEKEKLKSLTESIRELEKDYRNCKDEISKNVIKEKKNKLKLDLPCIYNINIEGKTSKSNVTEYNSLIILDFDHDDNKITSKTFTQLEEDPFILAMFESPSKGIKAIIRLDIPDGSHDYKKVMDFTERFAFNYISQYFLNTYELKVDEKCCNINRACYMPVGSKTYYNEDCSDVCLWSQYKPLKETKTVATTSKNKPSATASLLFTKSLEHLTNSGIEAFEDYNEWLNLGFILLGHVNGTETARSLFHSFSKLSKKYNQTATDSKWSSIVKSGYDPNKLSIKWFFRIMESRYGFNDKSNVYNSFKWTNNDIPDIFTNQMSYKLILDTVSKSYYLEKDEVMKKLDDIQLNSLLKDFRDSYMNLDKRTLEEYLFTNDIINEKNFLTDILESIKTTDRSEFDKIFVYLHSKNDDMTKKIFYRTMLGTMKNLFGEYGQYYDEILILKGEQMIGKSWFINNAYTKPFKEYTTTTFDYKDKSKDNLKLITAYMFIVDDELSMARRSDIEAVKRATSMPYAQMRLPYGKTWDNYKRIASFIGLTNSDDVFNDDTGGRRFLVCDIESIDKNMYQLDWNKIWGFIYSEWLSGKDPIMDSDISRDQILIHADEYRYKNDIEDYLLDNFDIVSTPTMTLDEVRNCIGTDFMLTHRQFNFSNRQIANKIKAVFKIGTTVVTTNGKSVRKYALKYKGVISTPMLIPNNKVIYRVNE